MFLDAGETILAPHPSFAALVAIILTEQGHSLTTEEVERADEVVFPKFIDSVEIGSTWSTSPEVSRRFWGSLYAALLEKLGIGDPGGRLVGVIYERFTRYESYRLFPDAIAALEAIREAGLTVGLISNFEGWLEEMLASWEVAHLFDVLAISGKVGVEKPDPKIFQQALQEARVEPSEAVYVGDHPRIDVEGAEAVGMTGVLIDRRDRFPDYPGRRITELTELLPILGLD